MAHLDVIYLAGFAALSFALSGCAQADGGSAPQCQLPPQANEAEGPVGDCCKLSSGGDGVCLAGVCTNRRVSEANAACGGGMGRDMRTIGSMDMRTINPADMGGGGEGGEGGEAGEGGEGGGGGGGGELPEGVEYDPSQNAAENRGLGPTFDPEGYDPDSDDKVVDEEVDNPWEGIHIHRRAGEILTEMKEKDGVELDPESLRTLVDNVPEDMTQAQLAELLARLNALRADETNGTSDPEVLMGIVMREVDLILNGVPPEAAFEEAAKSGERAAGETFQLDYGKAARLNKKWAGIIGFDGSVLVGQDLDVGSREFADAVASAQQRNALGVDGIAGPISVEAILRLSGKTDTAAYKKAKQILDQRAARAENEGGDPGGSRGGARSAGDPPRRLLMKVLVQALKSTPDGEDVPYMVDAVKLAEIKKDTYFHNDGLEVKFLDVTVESRELHQEDGAGNERILVISVIHRMAVVSLPEGADDDYPWKQGQVKDETFSEWWSPTRKKGGPYQNADAMNEAMLEKLAYDGTNWTVGDTSPGDFDMFHGKVIAVVGATKRNMDDGRVRHIVHVSVKPTIVDPDTTGVSTGSGGWVSFDVGRAVELPVVAIRDE